jgi:hypothetical protein
MKQTQHRREVKLGGSANKAVDSGEESAGIPEVYLRQERLQRFRSHLTARMTAPTLSWHIPSGNSKQLGACLSPHPRHCMPLNDYKRDDRHAAVPN